METSKENAPVWFEWDSSQRPATSSGRKILVNVIATKQLMNTKTQLTQRNLADRIADHLVAGIAKCEIPVGERLREVELCERLGVSRVPLREALRILQAQGIVTTIPNRGSYVAGFDSAETADMLEIRISVERTAFGRVLRLAREAPAILRALEPRIDDLRRAWRLDDRFIYSQADLAFHETVVELSGSPMLTAVWRSLARSVLFFMLQEPSSAVNYEEGVKEHEELLALMHAGSAESLQQGISKHILRNVQACYASAPAAF